MLASGSFRRVADRRDDVDVRAAAAEVPAHALADLVVAQLRGPEPAHVRGRRARRARARLGDQRRARADLTLIAVAALEGVALDEGALHRVQRLRRPEALGGDDLVALVREREREAGVDAAPVHEHRARAALAAVAAFLRARQAQVL